MGVIRIPGSFPFRFEPRVPACPSILLKYYQGSSSAYIIADTGCQRQVAGEGWHAQKRREVEPLCAIEFPDTYLVLARPWEAKEGLCILPLLPPSLWLCVWAA